MCFFNHRPIVGSGDARPGSGRRRVRAVECATCVVEGVESAVEMRADGRRRYDPETATVRLLGNRQDPTSTTVKLDRGREPSLAASEKLRRRSVAF